MRSNFLTNSRLISYDTPDGLRMKGFLAISPLNRATIIHIHGSCGNFYENGFLPYMAEIYTTAGLNFLSVNNRGHDCMAEAYRNGKLEYLGGYHELIEECIYDIEGALEFASQLGSRCILQGHSLGCLKVLMYLVQAKQPLDFILLSPSDSYQLQANYIQPETVEEQVSRIEREYAGCPSVILPSDEFGIRQQNLEYHIPTSPKTLLSLFGSPKTRLLAYRQSADYSLKVRAFIYYGGNDLLQTESPETVEAFFRERVSDVRFLVCEQGDHHFRRFESFVAHQIAQWAIEI